MLPTYNIFVKNDIFSNKKDNVFDNKKNTVGYVDGFRKIPYQPSRSYEYLNPCDYSSNQDEDTSILTVLKNASGELFEKTTNRVVEHLCALLRRDTNKYTAKDSLGYFFLDPNDFYSLLNKDEIIQLINIVSDNTDGKINIFDLHKRQNENEYKQFYKGLYDMDNIRLEEITRTVLLDYPKSKLCDYLNSINEIERKCKKDDAFDLGKKDVITDSILEKYKDIIDVDILKKSGAFGSYPKPGFLRI